MLFKRGLSTLNHFIIVVIYLPKYPFKVLYCYHVLNINTKPLWTFVMLLWSFGVNNSSTLFVDA
jgi:hypothetical protein